MSKIEVDAIEPQSGTTLTIGASGDTISVPTGATLDVNGIDFPTADGTAGQVLQTNGSGVLSFATPAGGKVLQVVSTTKIDTFTLSATNTFTDITGLSVTITPSSASNKILILTNISNGNVTANSSNAFRLMRGATAIGGGTASGNRQSSFAQSDPVNVNNQESASFNFLDSPNTTSSTTYKIQANCLATLTVNRSGNDPDLADPRGARTASSITVMEIAG
jgi:hypothetical protein